jgi:hypothetical protein
MAELYSDDFNDGNATGWSGNPAVTSSGPYEGAYCAELYSSGQYNLMDMYYNGFTNCLDFYMRAYVKWRGIWESMGYDGPTINYIEVLHETGSPSVFYSLETNSTGTSQMCLMTNYTWRAQTSGAISLDTWYCVEVRSKWDDESTVVELKINGETITSTDTLSTSLVNYPRFVGGAWNYGPAGLNFDAVVMRDDYYPGPIVADDFYSVVLAPRHNTLLRR